MRGVGRVQVGCDGWPHAGEVDWTETGKISSEKQLQLLPAPGLQVCTDTEKSLRVTEHGRLPTLALKQRGSLTLSVVAISEGRGDQRALREQETLIEV